MRTIKFRAKGKTSGNWVYSMTLANGHTKMKSYEYFMEIVPGRWVGVEKETIGQFTGLYDKNGKEVFEGDVIQILKDNDNGIFEIKWIDFATAFGIIEKGDDIERSRLIQKEVMLESVIIGNIHDNPELLEK